MEVEKFRFIKSDSPEQEQLVKSLFSNRNKLEDLDPDQNIKSLEFLIDNSFRRGSWGDFHECYQEYIIQNCPLSVLLILTLNYDIMEKLLKEKKVKNFKGDFAQYFRTFEAKDSNSVNRYTFKDFHLGHLMVGFESDKIKDLLVTEDTCGEFEVQHKSNQYMSSSKEKYQQGFAEKIINCRLKDMKDLDQKVSDKSEYKTAKGKSKKR